MHLTEENLKNLLVMSREKKENLHSVIVDEYPLEYIFFGRAEREFFQKDPASNLHVRPVFEDDSTVIYELERRSGSTEPVPA